MKNTEKGFVLASFNPVFCQIIMTGEGGECCWPKLRHIYREHVEDHMKDTPKFNPILKQRPRWNKPIELANYCNSCIIVMIVFLKIFFI